MYKTFSPVVVPMKVSSVQHLSSVTDLTSPSTPVVWWWAFLLSVIAFKWVDSGPLMHLALHVLPSLHLQPCFVRSLLNEQEIVPATYCREWTVLLGGQTLLLGSWTALLERLFFF